MVTHDARVGQVMLPFAVSEIGHCRLRASSRAVSISATQYSQCEDVGLVEKRNTKVEALDVPFQ